MCINQSIPTSHDYTCVQLTMQLCNVDIFNFRAMSRKTVVNPRPAVQHSSIYTAFQVFLCFISLLIYSILAFPPSHFSLSKSSYLPQSLLTPINFEDLSLCFITCAFSNTRYDNYFILWQWPSILTRDSAVKIFLTRDSAVKRFFMKYSAVKRFLTRDFAAKRFLTRDSAVKRYCVRNGRGRYAIKREDDRILGCPLSNAEGPL